MGLSNSLICRDFPPNEEPDWEVEEDIVGDLVLLGIVGIQDPVRPEVSYAIYGSVKGSGQYDYSCITIMNVCRCLVVSAPVKTVASLCGWSLEIMLRLRELLLTSVASLLLEMDFWS